jgi:O-antigen/teichoic acid export membrane protein
MGTINQLEQPTFSSGTEVPSLRSNFTWTFASNVAYAGCQWGMLSVLAKLGSPSVVGQFALGLAIAAPVFMFTNLQLRAVQATDALSEHRFANYFTLRFLATAIGLAFIAALTLFTPLEPTTRLVIVAVSVAKAIECMSDAVAGLLQKEERLDRVAVSLTIRGLASLFVFAVLFIRFRSVVISVTGMAVVWLFVFTFYDVRWAAKVFGERDGFFRFYWPDLRKLLLQSLPLGLVMTLGSLTVNIPRYFVQHYRGSTDLGIFASLAYMVVAINLIVYALGQSATTRLARMFAAGEVQTFRSLVWKMNALGALIILVGLPLALLAGGALLTLVYGREYADHIPLLALLVLSAGMNAIASFVTCGLNAARVFRAQVLVNFVVVTAVVLGSAILIPRYGLDGAGWALVLSALVSVSGASYVLSRHTRETTS